MIKYALPLLLLSTIAVAQDQRTITGKELLAQRIAGDSLTMANLIDEIKDLKDEIKKLKDDAKPKEQEPDKK